VGSQAFFVCDRITANPRLGSGYDDCTSQFSTQAQQVLNNRWKTRKPAKIKGLRRLQDSSTGLLGKWGFGKNTNGGGVWEKVLEKFLDGRYNDLPLN
jgi:accessory colonization factor AcfC